MGADVSTVLETVPEGEEEKEESEIAAKGTVFAGIFVGSLWAKIELAGPELADTELADTGSTTE